jgi:hypothetical protein
MIMAITSFGYLAAFLRNPQEHPQCGYRVVPNPVRDFPLPERRRMGDIRQRLLSLPS